MSNYFQAIIAVGLSTVDGEKSVMTDGDSNIVSQYCATGEQVIQMLQDACGSGNPYCEGIHKVIGEIVRDDSGEIDYINVEFERGELKF